MQDSRRLFTHVNNITATPVPEVAPSIPLVDQWTEEDKDRIFKTCKGVLVLPVSKFYGIENEALDRFILASKRCYNGTKMLGHLPHYMNYFEKYFDKDHELLMNLFRIKYLIDYEEDYTEEMLYPNYKPSVGKKIAQHLLECWDVINKYDPENMKRLSKDAGDEEYLTFAESLTDTDMQLAIISYVEILINLEICEVSYEQKKEIVQKNRIKRELYEEYMELQERRALFIKKLKEKKFPINAEKLIGNYFKAAQKDADGAYKALTKNPAMFSPIEFDKIRPKFFGLIKVTPEDGIKANQKIGEFIKKLKV